MAKETSNTSFELVNGDEQNAVSNAETNEVKETPAPEFEDIKSYTGKSDKNNKNLWQLSKVRPEPLTEYGNGIFKKLGGIIKVISFLVSFFIFAVLLVVGLILYKIDAFFIPFAVAIVIFGAIIALITMFLIYGLGQVICQNNEILQRLEKKGYH